ncbi:hypothetical protein C8R44DRAFT_885708 [Mycena epipterygia]|nr:hypothetical protein C8R44DRAFT_885708 [Mycena epipterygia]
MATTKKAAEKATGGRKRTPLEKAKAQKKKTKKSKADDDSSEDSEDDSNTPVLEVNWKDPELSVKLLALIMEHKHIKQSLYPPCGPNASTTKGGGKTKSNAQWDLFVLLLGKDSKYKDALAKCKAPKKQLAYANKIKNRLSIMAKIARAFNNEMGQTGAGIDNATQIDMSVTNSFTTKWAEISESCPWYFDMRNLIAQHPNLVPTGVGHSSMGFAADVIVPGPTPADDNEIAPEGQNDLDTSSPAPFPGWDATPGHTPEPEAHKRSFSEMDDAAGSGDDYQPSTHIPSELDPLDGDDDEAGSGDRKVDDEEEETGAGKVKAKKNETHHKNAAKPSTSTPTAALTSSASKPSKKTKIAEFSEIAKGEEKTRQKELDLATLRTRHAITSTEVKGRLVEKREERQLQAQEAKREERMAKLRMKEMRMPNAHELQMAAVSSRSHATRFFDTASSSSGSHYTRSETPHHDTFDAFDSFDGNATAGPSMSAADNVDFSLPGYDAMDDRNGFSFSSFLGTR